MNLKCKNCNTYKWLKERTGAVPRPQNYRCSECGGEFVILEFHCDGIQRSPDGKYWKIDMAKEICWEYRPAVVMRTEWQQVPINYK